METEIVIEKTFRAQLGETFAKAVVTTAAVAGTLSVLVSLRDALRTTIEDQDTDK